MRGGRDTPEKLWRHAERTARAWSLDGRPLLGVSVFAVHGMPLDELLARRFATFPVIHRPTVARLREHGFELLATGLSPHFTVRLLRADELELTRLLDAFGAPRHNPQYGSKGMIWREGGRDVPRGYHR